MSFANFRHHTASCLTALSTILLSACDTGERLTTNTLLANSNCKGIDAPIALVALADVARFRGTELVQLNTTPTPESETDLDLPLFVALSRGEQPTRGYELHLADQARTLDSLAVEIPVYWTEPDPSKAHPLVTTHPCLVVSIPNRNWQTIEAVDQNGNSIGVVTPSQPSGDQ